MQIVDSAIILGTVQVKDNNNVVKMFTKSNGLQSAYLVATTKKKSAKNAVLQPLSICQVKYLNNKKSSIPSLKEASIEVPLLNIQMDIFKSTVALFIADFLSEILPQDTEDRFFDFIKNSIQIFNEIEDGMSNFHLVFLLKMTKWLGIKPSLKKEFNNYFDLKEGEFLSQQPNHSNYLSTQETNIIARFLVVDWNDISEIKLNGKLRRKLLNSIIHYYIFHVPGFKKPKALTILEEVFD